jgi:lipoate synthase
MVVRISTQLEQSNTEQLAAVCAEALCIGIYECIQNKTKVNIERENNQFNPCMIKL